MVYYLEFGDYCRIAAEVLGLYRWLEWPEPSSSESNPGETAAFAVHPKPVAPGSAPFVQPYLNWRTRLAVAARNVDSAVYEVDLKVDVKWTDDSGVRQAEALPPRYMVRCVKEAGRDENSMVGISPAHVVSCLTICPA
jgi:hypothetical protein